jgi:hypothetical protein
MTGADFDRAYLKEAGVKAHEKMEKLFMREAERGRDADLKSFASSTLPTVQGHLRMAREMMTGMSGKGTSMSGGTDNSNTKGRRIDSGAGTMGESQGSGVDTNPSKRSTSNSNTSGNSNTGNSNTGNSNGNSNTGNANGNSNNPR